MHCQDLCAIVRRNILALCLIIFGKRGHLLNTIIFTFRFIIINKHVMTQEFSRTLCYFVLTTSLQVVGGGCFCFKSCEQKHCRAIYFSTR